MRSSRLLYLVIRTLLGAIGLWFISLDENPLVRLEAKLGLSPAPFERFTSLQGPFSGMTEGMYQLTKGNLRAAVRSNVLTPAAATIVLLCLVFGRVPHIRTRKDEQLFFAGVLCATIMVNLANKL
jgi:hypothetical protein